MFLSKDCSLSKDFFFNKPSAFLDTFIGDINIDKMIELSKVVVINKETGWARKIRDDI